MKVRASLVIVLVALCAIVAHVQRGSFVGGGGGGGNGSSRPVSPSVVSAIWSHDDDDHVPVLEFLILLRGAPGWFITAGPGSNGYNFNMSNGRTLSHAFATGGNVTVTIDSDSAVPNKKLMVVSNLTTVLDRLIAPDDVNIVLVDGVDGSRSPVTVRTMKTEPKLGGEGDAFTRVIKGSPELFAFLQCDVPLPDTLPGAANQQLRVWRTMIPKSCNALH